jgi:hypothetical protein
LKLAQIAQIESLPLNYVIFAILTNTKGNYTLVGGENVRRKKKSGK